MVTESDVPFIALKPTKHHFEVYLLEQVTNHEGHFQFTSCNCKIIGTAKFSPTIDRNLFPSCVIDTCRRWK